MNAPAERKDAMNAFLAATRWGAAKQMPLAGDASTRRYIRLRLGERSAMLMDQPQGAEQPVAVPNATPEQRRALGYNAVARLAGADCERFVAVANHLRGCGLGAPEIYAADGAQGFVLLEDFGDDLYADVLARGNDEATLYAAAIDAMARLQAEAAPAMLIPGKPLFAYDETALLAEADLLAEWFLPMALNRAVGADEAAGHRALWRAALAPHLAEPAVFVHRDYHAQNLFWLPARAGHARAGLIDFQDAVAGAPAYDLVSLLEDARRDVSPGLAETMTARYLARRRAEGHTVDEAHFRAAAALFAAQRNAKIIGIFARLWKRDSKPRYLAYLPRVWRYMERDLGHPALARLKAWYDRILPREARGAPKGQGDRR